MILLGVKFQCCCEYLLAFVLSGAIIFWLLENERPMCISRHRDIVSVGVTIYGDVYDAVSLQGSDKFVTFWKLIGEKII